MKIKWKSIPGIPKNYEVSNMGDVRMESLNNEYVNIEGYFNQRTGYKYVTINKHKFPIHRLVAMAFIDNPKNYDCVIHKDDNKLNNNVDNLEWCSRAYFRNKYVENQDDSLIRCIETNKVYRNISSVSYITGIPIPIIKNAIQSGNSCFGYHYELASAENVTNILQMSMSQIAEYSNNLSLEDFQKMLKTY